MRTRGMIFPPAHIDKKTGEMTGSRLESRIPKTMVETWLATFAYKTTVETACHVSLQGKKSDVLTGPIFAHGRTGTAASHKRFQIALQLGTLFACQIGETERLEISLGCPHGKQQPSVAAHRGRTHVKNEFHFNRFIQGFAET